VTITFCRIGGKGGVFLSYVFVLDTNKQPLNPVHPGWARKLLSSGRAAVYKRYPFTIILKVAVQNAEVQLLRLKIDPGSKTTGIAVVNDNTGDVPFAAELEHRGQRIKKSMDSRRAIRSGRRSRKTRYRKPRFLNRGRKEGWLPPSLRSRVENIETWIRRLRSLCPITAISLELVKFDTQAMLSPEISGVEYQQGELQGYEVREYLLEKFGRKCVYCGAENIPLQIEHIVPKARGGSNRVSNLTLACEPCNRKKGNQTAEEFGHPKVQAQAKKPLKDAAAVNTTRWALYRRIESTGLPLEVGTGGRTKYNRSIRKLPKTHWLDAACVGASTPESLLNRRKKDFPAFPYSMKVEGIRPLVITAMGRGSRQMCRVDKYGFPRTSAKKFKRVMLASLGGLQKNVNHKSRFQTGDMVKAVVKSLVSRPVGSPFASPLRSEPTGKKAGTYIGRVAIRSTGSFNVKTKSGTVQGISYRYCQMLQRTDGYAYEWGAAFLPS